MKRDHTLLNVVIFTVAMVLVAAMLVVVFGQFRFASETGYHATFTDASRLKAGQDVRIAGVPVGKVTSVTRSGTQAQLTLSVDSSVGEIHRDATVALQPRMMFEGTAYVALTPGTPSAPPLVVVGLDAELEFHFQMRTEELIGRGMNRDHARREAEREFGDMSYTRQYCETLDRAAHGEPAPGRGAVSAYPRSPLSWP